jgi:hypothetical protein
MTYEEEDWVDQDATAHRGPDEQQPPRPIKQALSVSPEGPS